MATIPVWMIGKHLVSVTLYPQTVGTSGILADASTKGITTQLDSYQLNLAPTLENINAVNQPRGNNVVVEDDFSVSLNLIEVHNASDPDPLATIILTNDYFKAVFVKGTQAGSIETWTLYGARGAFSEGLSGKGKQMASLELHAIDVGSTAYLVRTVT